MVSRDSGTSNSLLARKKSLYSDPDRRPDVLPPDFGGIPAELRAERRWLLWKLEWRGDNKGGGKWTKVPRQPSGRAAKSTDPATWSAFEQVRAAFEGGGFDGVGFVLGGGWAGVDLDGSYDHGTGEVVGGWPDRLAAATYTEVSPSGTGVKGVGRGAGWAGRHKVVLPDGVEAEVYDDARYFAITGVAFGDKGVADLQPLLSDLGKEFAAKPERAKRTSKGAAAEARNASTMSDAELLDRIRRSAQGAKFAALYDRGDLSMHGGDQNRADLALCEILAWWTRGDSAAIDRLFRQSRLMRSWKWDDRRGESTYGANTVAEAVRLNGDAGYSPGARATVGAAGGDGEPRRGHEIIRAYFEERYRPVFKSGNAVQAHDGTEVAQNVACGAAPSRLIEALAAAVDAPRFQGGGLNENALPGFFRKWAPTAWADLLESLPEEEQAELQTSAPAAEEFRRLVRGLMLTPVTLGGRNEDRVRDFERKSLAHWCQRFAKARWSDIRSFKCYCRVRQHDKQLLIAVTHDLIGQVGGDKRLMRMGSNRFAVLCRKYGVGAATREERPQGQWAIVLSDEFVNSLLAGLPAAARDDEHEEEDEFAGEAPDLPFVKNEKLDNSGNSNFAGGVSPKWRGGWSDVTNLPD